MIGPLLAIVILGAFLVFLIPWVIRERREDRELERRIKCGPGCICGGENLRARQQIVVHTDQPNYQQQPQIIYIQTSQRQPAPPQTPQIVYLQAPQQPQPQPMYLPAPQDQRQARYLPAPQTAYPEPQPHPWQHPDYPPAPPIYTPQYHPQQAPQSYYPSPAPIVEEYRPDYPQPQPARQIPQARIQYLPPAPISPRDEVERRLESWQLERELERRRR